MMARRAVQRVRMSKARRPRKGHPVEATGTGAFYGTKSVSLEPPPAGHDGARPEGTQGPRRVRGDQREEWGNYEGGAGRGQGAPDPPPHTPVLDPSARVDRRESEEGDSSRDARSRCRITGCRIVHWSRTRRREGEFLAAAIYVDRRPLPNRGRGAPGTRALARVAARCITRTGS